MILRWLDGGGAQRDENGRHPGWGEVQMMPCEHKQCLCYDKIENFNYLNVAFISYKLTMLDCMLYW